MRKICFVALYAYPLFNPNVKHIFGGAEVRAWLFGLGLSKLPNNEVSFIVLNHGQPWVEEHSLIKVYPHTHYKASSAFTARLTNKIQNFLNCLLYPYKSTLFIDDYPIPLTKYLIYERVNADLYCTFGVSNFSAELARFCRRYNKRFVLFSTSDRDFSVDYYPNSTKRNIYGSNGALCYYTIMQADLIITQTKTQSELLMKRFGRTSATVYNPIDLTPIKNVDNRHSKEEHIILWVGKSDQNKQPEILLDLALNFPDILFIMVLNRSDPKIHARVLQKKPRNVRIIENIDFADVESLFAKSFLFINTSVFEGFPNTFLQAGKFGVPILSFQVDPDGFIKGKGCGIVAGGKFEKLIEGVHYFISDSRFYEVCSKNIKRYVFSHHELNSTVRGLNQIITDFFNNRH